MTLSVHLAAAEGCRIRGMEECYEATMAKVRAYASQTVT
jgi:hypothetical protein